MKRLNVLFISMMIAIATLILVKNFSRHEEPLSPLKKEAIILAFGDSLTYGTGAGRGESYPAFLEHRINRKVINAGIPGELSEEGLKRLPYLLDSEHPDILILCHGGNDILKKKGNSSLRANLESMIRIAKKRHIDVILIAVPEFSLLHLSANPVYDELSETYSLPIENDILSKLLSDNRYKSDYIHPNTAGYEKMAEAIEKILRENYKFEE